MGSCKKNRIVFIVLIFLNVYNYICFYVQFYPQLFSDNGRYVLYNAPNHGVSSNS